MNYKNKHFTKIVVYEAAIDYYTINKISIKDCAIKFGVDRHNLSKWIKEKGLKTKPHNKQFIKSNIFSIINTEEKAYWLGFLYADGNLSKSKNFISLELSIKDKKHLEKFRLFIGKELPLRNDSYRCRCVFQDKLMYEDLIKLGCVPNKSLILTYPFYTQVPKNLMKHFIRGYFDGDGSVYISNNNIHISVIGTDNFLNSMVQEINLPKRKLYKNSKNNNSNCYFFSYSGTNAKKFLDYLYTDSKIYLERKYTKFKSFA